MTIRSKYLRSILAQALKNELGVSTYKNIPKYDPLLNEKDLHYVEGVIMALPEVRLFCADESQAFRIFTFIGFYIRGNLRRRNQVGGGDTVLLREWEKIIIRSSISAIRRILKIEERRLERHSNTSIAKLSSKDATERERI